MKLTFRALLRPLALLLSIAVLDPVRPVAAAEPPAFTRTEDVIYGRKFGTALTFDVFQPARSNGCAVLFMVSGGFFSAKEMMNVGMFRPFLDRGYTVFAILHGSQPKYTIPEATADIQRAVRFIRRDAARWGVNPDRFGITGASAGGHLSLTLATQGGPGKPDASDPTDRTSSAVQAAACFFPPTDFLNWRSPGDDAVGVGILKDFKPAFGPRSDTPEGRQAYGREISPIYFVTSNLPPTLIIHGDADKLVPIYQAEQYRKRARESGNVCEVIVRPGKDHGWPGLDKDIEILADWFDRHLRGIQPPAAAQP